MTWDSGIISQVAVIATIFIYLFIIGNDKVHLLNIFKSNSQQASDHPVMCHHYFTCINTSTNDTCATSLPTDLFRELRQLLADQTSISFQVTSGNTETSPALHCLILWVVACGLCLANMSGTLCGLLLQ